MSLPEPLTQTMNISLVKIALSSMIATYALLLASPAQAQTATSPRDLLPTAEDLGPGWVEVTSTVPTPDPVYPEARGWYAGPNGSRVVLLVSIPPANILAGNWEVVAQAIEASAPESLLSPEHPSATPLIAGCTASRRVQGLPASFPVLTEAITACRTSDAILHARVSGTWQGLTGTAASDALIQLLLDHRNGRATGAPSLPPVASLARLLPSTSELPPGLELASEGALTAGAMPLTFPAPGEAAQRLASWGWQENAYRSFVAASHLAPGAPSSVEISLHRFASDSAAASALPYFAKARAEARGLSVAPVESIQPDEAAVVGTGAEGNEATLFVRLGDVLVRVTAVVPDGPAEDVAREVANAVVAKQAHLIAE